MFLMASFENVIPSAKTLLRNFAGPMDQQKHTSFVALATAVLADN